MRIDAIDISQFNAVQQKVDIQTSDILNVTNKDTILTKKNKFGNKNIRVELVVKGKSRSVVLENISNIIALLEKMVVLNLNGYEKTYECTLYNKETVKTKISTRYKLILEFKGEEKSQEIITNFNNTNSGSINLKSNKSTPCILEITPSIDIIDLIIEGVSEAPITIKNLKANKKFILDGEKFKATVDNINKFTDVDLWEFPGLAPGVNNLKFSRNNCNITIKYKPMWV